MTIVNVNIVFAVVSFAASHCTRLLAFTHCRSRVVWRVSVGPAQENNDRTVPLATQFDLGDRHENIDESNIIVL